MVNTEHRHLRTPTWHPLIMDSGFLLPTIWTTESGKLFSNEKPNVFDNGKRHLQGEMKMTMMAKTFVQETWFLFLKVFFRKK